jgi:hypothetical protein
VEDGKRAREWSRKEVRWSVISRDSNKGGVIKMLMYYGMVRYHRNSSLSATPERKIGESNSGSPNWKLQGHKKEFINLLIQLNGPYLLVAYGSSTLVTHKSSTNNPGTVPGSSPWEAGLTAAWVRARPVESVHWKQRWGYTHETTDVKVSQVITFGRTAVSFPVWCNWYL